MTEIYRSSRSAGWSSGSACWDLLAAQRTGLLITVDETHAADRTELAPLAANIQHFIRAQTGQ